VKLSEKMILQNKLGLHLRAAAELVKVANKFKSQISVGRGMQNVNAKSLLGLMTLAASRGTELEFTAEGDDAAEALTALRQLVGQNFKEKQ
jgi:phosphotransferase system HPr (HPr) family protein